MIPPAAASSPPAGTPAAEADVASVSGDFAALLALVAGAVAATSPDDTPPPAAPDVAPESPEPGEGAATPTGPVAAAVPPAGCPTPVLPAEARPAHEGGPPAHRAEAGPVLALPEQARPLQPGPTEPPGHDFQEKGRPPVTVPARPVSEPAPAVPAAGDVPERPALAIPEAPPALAIPGAPPAPAGHARVTAAVSPPPSDAPRAHVAVPQVAVDASPVLVEAEPVSPVPPATATVELSPARPQSPDDPPAATPAAPTEGLAETGLPRVPAPAQPAPPAGRPPAAPDDRSAPAGAAPLQAPARADALGRPEFPGAASPVTPPAVPDQVVSAVVPLHGRGDGRHEVTLELRPAHLGAIRVEVTVEHQTVHVTLHAADPATGRLLSAALPELRSALADAGLTAGFVGVGPDGGGGGAGRPHASDESSERRPAGSGRPRNEDTRDGTPVGAVRPTTTGRLDLFL